jgi:phosphoglycolate phosphatase-like HAD superfamily hydrolase
MALQGAIFDVDGVLVDSPHELAWREALRDLKEGDWRDIRDRTSYAPERFTPAVYQQAMAGMPRMEGARAALEHYGVPDVEKRIEQYAAGKQEHAFKLIEQGQFTAFPDALLHVRPGTCFVIEDATSGIAAAKAGKMAGLGVARIDDTHLLAAAGADLVVTTLDDVSLDALMEGRLRERSVVAERRRRQTERPNSVWSLQYNGFDPKRQGLREALCTLGNGYFATRGALAEADADDTNYPGTYVASLYNRLSTNVAGREVENEDLVNIPNWLPFAFRIEGDAWFDITQTDVLDHRIKLDVQ